MIHIHQIGQNRAAKISQGLLIVVCNFSPGASLSKDSHLSSVTAPSCSTSSCPTKDNNMPRSFLITRSGAAAAAEGATANPPPPAATEKRTTKKRQLSYETVAALTALREDQQHELCKPQFLCFVTLRTSDLPNTCTYYTPGVGTDLLLLTLSTHPVDRLCCNSSCRECSHETSPAKSRNRRRRSSRRWRQTAVAAANGGAKWGKKRGDADERGKVEVQDDDRDRPIDRVNQ